MLSAVLTDDPVTGKPPDASIRGSLRSTPRNPRENEIFGSSPNPDRVGRSFPRLLLFRNKEQEMTPVAMLADVDRPLAAGNFHRDDGDAN